MARLIQSAFLLGQAEPTGEFSTEEFSRAVREAFGFEAQEGNIPYILIVVLGIVLAAFALGWLVSRRSHRAPVLTVNYFEEALRVLGCSMSERKDLRRIAAASRMTPAASLLLSPANLAAALEAANQNEGLDKELAARVNEFARRVFGAPLHTN